MPAAVVSAGAAASELAASEEAAVLSAAEEAVEDAVEPQPASRPAAIMDARAREIVCLDFMVLSSFLSGTSCTVADGCGSRVGNVSNLAVALYYTRVLQKSIVFWILSARL